VAEWLDGVDLLDPEAVAAAARPVMAAMTNPNGLDRAHACLLGWWAVLPPEVMERDDWRTLAVGMRDRLDLVGLDLMGWKDWCESATGVRR